MAEINIILTVTYKDKDVERPSKKLLSVAPPRAMVNANGRFIILLIPSLTIDVLPVIR